MLIAPSVLSADFSKLGEEITRITRAGSDWVHLDVMDGRFVPNITFGPPVVAAMRPYTKLPFDVHLMMDEPLRYLPEFRKAGADRVTFHIEAQSPPAETIEAIRRGGAEPAVALKPGTPVEAVFPFLDRISMVLVMTVEPGFGGQKFMPEMMEKVRAIKKRRPDILVQVDGGINETTVREAALAGVDVSVAGTSVFRADDAAAAIAALKAACADC